MSAEPEKSTGNESTTGIPAEEHLLNNAHCLGHIFSNLSVKDRNSVELSCSYWRTILRRTPTKKKSILEIVYSDHPTLQVQIMFDGVVRRVALTVTQPTENSGYRNDVRIDNEMYTIVQEILRNYGYAVSELRYGGDGGTTLSVVEDSIDVTLPVSTNFLRTISDMAPRNLTSISFQSVSIDNETWLRFAEMIHVLRTQGKLETVCLHKISGIDPTAENLAPVAENLVQLKRLGVSSIPYVLTTTIGEANVILEDENEGGDQEIPILVEMYVKLSQFDIVTCHVPDMANLMVLQAARNVNLELHIREFWETGVEETVIKMFRLVRHRLKSLDIRFWWSERQAPMHAINVSPIGNLVQAFMPILDSLQQLSLFGNELTFNNGTFSSFVAVLSTAQNLRRLSLGKVCGKRMNKFFPLSNLTQLEWLYISTAPNLDNKELKLILDRLPFLKRLWLLEVPLITEATILPFLNQLEAIEISRCQSFRPKVFFERLLRQLQKWRKTGTGVDLGNNLEFIRIKGCRNYDFNYLKWADRFFKDYGVTITMNETRRYAILVFKNHAQWRNIETIRLPWYNCQYCDVETSY